MMTLLIRFSDTPFDVRNAFGDLCARSMNSRARLQSSTTIRTRLRRPPGIFPRWYPITLCGSSERFGTITGTEPPSDNLFKNHTAGGYRNACSTLSLEPVRRRVIHAPVGPRPSAEDGSWWRLAEAITTESALSKLSLDACASHLRSLLLLQSNATAARVSICSEGILKAAEQEVAAPGVALRAEAVRRLHRKLCTELYALAGNLDPLLQIGSKLFEDLSLIANRDQKCFIRFTAQPGQESIVNTPNTHGNLEDYILQATEWTALMECWIQQLCSSLHRSSLFFSKQPYCTGLRPDQLIVVLSLVTAFDRHLTAVVAAETEAGPNSASRCSIGISQTVAFLLRTASLSHYLESFAAEKLVDFVYGASRLVMSSNLAPNVFEETRQKLASQFDIIYNRLDRLLSKERNRRSLGLKRCFALLDAVAGFDSTAPVIQRCWDILGESVNSEAIPSTDIVRALELASYTAPAAVSEEIVERLFPRHVRPQILKLVGSQETSARCGTSGQLAAERLLQILARLRLRDTALLFPLLHDVIPSVIRSSVQILCRPPDSGAVSEMRELSDNASSNSRFAALASLTVLNQCMMDLDISTTSVPRQVIDGIETADSDLWLLCGPEILSSLLLSCTFFNLGSAALYDSLCVHLIRWWVSLNSSDPTKIACRNNVALAELLFRLGKNPLPAPPTGALAQCLTLARETERFRGSNPQQPYQPVAKQLKCSVEVDKLDWLDTAAQCYFQAHLDVRLGPFMVDFVTPMKRRDVLDLKETGIAFNTSSKCTRALKQLASRGCAFIILDVQDYFLRNHSRPRLIPKRRLLFEALAALKVPVISIDAIRWRKLHSRTAKQTFFRNAFDRARADLLPSVEPTPTVEFDRTHCGADTLPSVELERTRCRN